MSEPKWLSPRLKQVFNVEKLPNSDFLDFRLTPKKFGVKVEKTK